MLNNPGGLDPRPYGVPYAATQQSQAASAFPLAGLPGGLGGGLAGNRPVGMANALAQQPGVAPRNFGNMQGGLANNLVSVNQLQQAYAAQQAQQVRQQQNIAAAQGFPNGLGGNPGIRTNQPNIQLSQMNPQLAGVRGPGPTQYDRMAPGGLTVGMGNAGIPQQSPQVWQHNTALAAAALNQLGQRAAMQLNAAQGQTMQTRAAQVAAQQGQVQHPMMQQANQGYQNTSDLMALLQNQQKRGPAPASAFGTGQMGGMQGAGGFPGTQAQQQAQQQMLGAPNVAMQNAAALARAQSDAAVAAAQLKQQQQQQQQQSVAAAAAVVAAHQGKMHAAAQAAAAAPQGGQHGEFQIQTEDFPALPGAVQQRGPDDRSAFSTQAGPQVQQPLQRFGQAPQIHGIIGRPGALPPASAAPLAAEQHSGPDLSRGSAFMDMGSAVPGGYPPEQLLRFQQQQQAAANAGQLPKAGLGGGLGGLVPLPATGPTGPSPLLKNDNYGLLGLLDVIKMTDPDRTMLALGTDLTSLGLNLNSPDTLFKSFVSPLSDQPIRAEPEFVVPSCYKHNPPRLQAGFLSKFKEETLFYIFYSMPQDEAQLIAADELATRGWWFHKAMKCWMTRVTGPVTKTQRGERGSYLVFDTNIWDAVQKTDFEILYEDIEQLTPLKRPQKQQVPTARA